MSDIKSLGRMVKIVATLGPASWKAGTVKKLFQNGTDVFRLNFSHGNYSVFRNAIKTIRAVSDDCAILIDLPGPKIRTGKVLGERAELKRGGKVMLTDKNSISDASRIFVDYPYLSKDIKPGSLVYIDDGRIKLRAEKKLKSGELMCGVLTPGILRAEKGINFPDAPLSIPSVTEKDYEFLRFGAEQGVDMFAVSFVRKAEDVGLVKDFLRKNYPEKDFFVVAKIEKIEAVRNISAIAAVADAVMVARGDLGVEAPVENIPIEQKKIITAANSAGKPVITATQMLISMTENESPTRAEVTDVSNSIFDGTDAVMLSEETAIGKNPALAVKYMSKIINATGKSAAFRRGGGSRRGHGPVLPGRGIASGAVAVCPAGHEREAACGENISFIIAEAAVMASELLKNSVIVAITRSGYTASLISSFKPQVPIIAVVPSDGAKRRLSLNFGVRAIVEENIAGNNVSIEDIIQSVKNNLKSNGRIRPSFAVLTGGIPIGKPGSTDFVKIVRLF